MLEFTKLYPIVFSKLFCLRFWTHSYLQKTLRIFVMKIKCHWAINSNNVLTSSVLRFLNNYWIPECIDYLKPLSESNHSCLSKWMITKFDRGSNLDRFCSGFSFQRFFVFCRLFLFQRKCPVYARCQHIHLFWNFVFVYFDMEFSFPKVLKIKQKIIVFFHYANFLLVKVE